MSKVRVFLHFNNSVYPITKPTFRVGRNSFCDIVLSERFISDIHFCIQTTGESYIFCDGDMKYRNSKNGSIVDGVFVSNGDCVYLKNESIICIQNITMKFVVEIQDNDKSKETSAFDK